MKPLLGILCIVGSIVIGVILYQQRPATTSGNKPDLLKRNSPPIVLLAVGLRLLLSGGSAGTVARPLPKRATNLPGGPDTVASNPARLDLNYGQWLAAHPTHIGFFAVLAFGGLILLAVKWQAGLILLSAVAITFWRSRQELRRKFSSGDVCPGVVLAADQGLVAVWTDLKAAANIPRPALKILKQPLRKIQIYALQDGMRIACVAEYYGQAQETAWKNFFPEVIPCVVHDESENQRLLEAIPEEQWQALDQGLARIPALNPGLYRLWGNNLAADASSSVPWLQRTWVRVSLASFALLGVSFLALQTWAHRSMRLREERAPANSSQPGHNAATPPLPPRPGSAVRDLSGKTLSFTNLTGQVFQDIELIQADPGLLTYQVHGDKSRMPLALVPIQIQDELNIPPDWHGYRAAQNSSFSRAPDRGEAGARPAPNPATAPTAGAYQPGQKIYAQWAGKWIPGTVVERFGIGLSYRVQLNDPRFRNSLVLGTNLLRPQ